MMIAAEEAARGNYFYTRGRGESRGKWTPSRLL